MSDAAGPLAEHIYARDQTGTDVQEKSKVFVNNYSATAKVSLKRGIRILGGLISKTREYDIAQFRKKTFTTV